MTVKEKVYMLLVNTGDSLTVSEIVQSVSPGNRTYVSRILSELVADGKIEFEKVGRNLFYHVSRCKVFYEENLDLKNLDENNVWEIIKKEIVSEVSEKTENVLYFSFTEMLNNAVDHSKSGHAYVKIWEEDNSISFVIKDHGIGVFNSLIAKKGYSDEIEAIQELIKGKVTTAPKWHSGEGIFWTSKIADYYSLSSYDYELALDNSLSDYTIKKLDGDERVTGTEVYFRIDMHTEKSLVDLFRNYSLNHDTYSFDTTFIPVKLFEAGEVWISRSQAKRILQGLEKYKKIVIDFSNIEMVGQGFVDEIFRVFVINHPGIEIEPINMNESVRMMVERVQSDRTGRDA